MSAEVGLRDRVLAGLIVEVKGHLTCTGVRLITVSRTKGSGTLETVHASRFLSAVCIKFVYEARPGVSLSLSPPLPRDLCMLLLKRLVQAYSIFRVGRVQAVENGAFVT